MFLQCSGTLDISYLDQLTHGSLMVIINGLADYISGTRFIKLGDANLAKLTDEEKEIATSKGWTIV